MNDFGTGPVTQGRSNSKSKAGTFVNVTIEVNGKAIQVATFLEGACITQDLPLDKVVVKSANLRGYDPAAPKDKASEFLAAFG